MTDSGTWGQAAQNVQAASDGGLALIAIWCCLVGAFALSRRVILLRSRNENREAVPLARSMKALMAAMPLAAAPNILAAATGSWLNSLDRLGQAFQASHGARSAALANAQMDSLVEAARPEPAKRGGR